MPRLNAPGAMLLAIGLLLGSYALHSRDAGRIAAVLASPVPLRKALSHLPVALGDWRGEDAPLEEGTAEVAGADDYVSRRYRNVITGEVLSAYISYYGNPRAMVGHYPEVCYPAFGWKRELKRTERVKGVGAAEKESWPAQVYRFSKGMDQTTVVSFFNAGGRYTADREVVKEAAHGALGAQNRNYLVQMQFSFPGNLPVNRTLHVTGRWLSELLPKLDEHLPGPATDEPAKVRE